MPDALQNATIRENICFGRPFEEDKYWQAIKDSCLETDLDMLPNGDMTEVLFHLHRFAAAVLTSF